MIGQTHWLSLGVSDFLSGRTISPELSSFHFSFHKGHLRRNESRHRLSAPLTLLISLLFIWPGWINSLVAKHELVRCSLAVWGLQESAVWDKAVRCCEIDLDANVIVVTSFKFLQENTGWIPFMICAFSYLILIVEAPFIKESDLLLQKPKGKMYEMDLNGI